MFGCHAIAAVLGGWIARKHGYGAVLSGGAMMAAASAVLFRVLLSPAPKTKEAVSKASGPVRLAAD
jgi:hypothetical protein